MAATSNRGLAEISRRSSAPLFPVPTAAKRSFPLRSRPSAPRRVSSAAAPAADVQRNARRENLPENVIDRSRIKITAAEFVGHKKHKNARRNQNRNRSREMFQSTRRTPSSILQQHSFFCVFSCFSWLANSAPVVADVRRCVVGRDRRATAAARSTCSTRPTRPAALRLAPVPRP